MNETSKPAAKSPDARLARGGIIRGALDSVRSERMSNPLLKVRERWNTDRALKAQGRKEAASARLKDLGDPMKFGKKEFREAKKLQRKMDRYDKRANKYGERRALVSRVLHTDGQAHAESAKGKLVRARFLRLAAHKQLSAKTRARDSIGTRIAQLEESAGNNPRATQFIKGLRTEFNNMDRVVRGLTVAHGVATRRTNAMTEKHSKTIGTWKNWGKVGQDGLHGLRQEDLFKQQAEPSAGGQAPERNVSELYDDTAVNTLTVPTEGSYASLYDKAPAQRQMVAANDSTPEDTKEGESVNMIMGRLRQSMKELDTNVMLKQLRVEVSKMASGARVLVNDSTKLSSREMANLWDAFAKQSNGDFPKLNDVARAQFQRDTKDTTFLDLAARLTKKPSEIKPADVKKGMLRIAQEFAKQGEGRRAASSYTV
jgi:hypothetical protein